MIRNYGIAEMLSLLVCNSFAGRIWNEDFYETAMVNMSNIFKSFQYEATPTIYAPLSI